MKIGTRITTGYLVMLLLMLAVAAVSYINMHRLTGEISSLSSDKWVKNQHLRNMHKYMDDVSIALRDLAMATDSELRKKADQSIAKGMEGVDQNLNGLEKSILLDSDKRQLAVIRESRSSYLDELKSFTELIHSGKGVEYAPLLGGELSRKKGAYEKAVEEMAAVQAKEIERLGAEAERIAGISNVILFLLTLVGVIGALSLAWYLSRTISMPINRCIEAAARIAEGDTAVSLDTSASDEFGDLQRSIAKTAESVNALITDGDKLTATALEGKLDNRIDAARHKGEFRRVMQGFNDTLDAIINPLILSAEYMERISKGEIPSKITDSYKGDFNEIKNNINICIDAINDLVTDGISLTAAALDGKLDIRVDAGKHKGEFRRIMQGFNDTLDAVITPLVLSAEYMERISKGEIPPKITDSYKGDFNEIKNNLNTCIDAINDLVTDGISLAAAAVEGRLSVRTDASRHKGEFRRIVQGFNSTLDSVVMPVNEIRAIMESMASGDLNRRMTIETRGEFALLKESLNKALTNLSSTIENVTQNARQVASASAQTSGAVGQISDGSQNQLHAIGQVATAIRQTATSIADVSRNTEEASHRAKDSVGIVNEGKAKMAQMILVVNNIASNSEKINKITDVIEKIANKTNLLSLNAAIEAARAGEHGRGFAVVAEEVGKLAANAADSTQEIVALVDQAVKEARQAVSTVNEVSDGMTRISDGAMQTETMLQRISASLEEQSAAIQEVNANISSLNKVAESNAAASEEITATVVELARLADNTRKEAERFRM